MNETHSGSSLPLQRVASVNVKAGRAGRLGVPVPRRSRLAAATSLAVVGAQLALTLAACAPAGGGAPAGQSDQGTQPGANAAAAGSQDAGRSGAPGTAGTTGAPASGVGLPGAGLIPGIPAARAASLPAPSTVLETARTRLLHGDYPKAIQELASIQANYPGTPEAAEALFFQANALLSDDQFAPAEEHLRRFIALYPDHVRRGVATLMLGRALESQGNGGAAIDVYRQYEAVAEPGASLADFINLKASQIYFIADRAADGWAALGNASNAAQTSPSNALRTRLYDELALRYWNAGDKARTVEVRRAALESAVAGGRPARELAPIAWRLVGAYMEAGERAQADAVRRRIINEWPATANALQALMELGVESTAPFQRSIIYYYNRRWQSTVDVLTPYINSGQSDAEGKTAEARYMRAVALTRLGNDEALAALDRVYERHSNTEWADDALWEAATLLVRKEDRPAAAARFEQLAVGYPESEHRGQALYWLGKLLPELGNPASAQRYMQAAAAAGHEDFYTFRARTALRQAAPSPKPLAGQENVSAAERAAWTEWLSVRGYPADTQAQKRAEIEADGRFKRGTVLLEAGFRADAEQEFLELVRVAKYDPVVVEHVALQVRDRGFYPLSVTLGHRLLETVNEMGEPSLLAAPRVVQKLILPLAFLELVEPAAKAKGLDPLMMLGLMKQESWFEPRAASTAQARGLTQFIRETATTVAGELRWPNWTWDDMNRPYVSVPFGAHYLSTLIKDFRGNYHYALAGYNGGPGNVLRWAKGDWNRDLDLFVEEITYIETRGYVKAVTGNYELYKAIYYR